MKSGWLKGLKIGSGVFAFAFVGIGVLHMPFAKSFLMKVGGCPVVKASPEQAEAFRVAANAATNTSTVLAPARPALGFDLEKTTADDVLAWGRTNNLDCSQKLNRIHCNDVPSALVGENGPNIVQAEFTFRPSDGKLNIVGTFRNQLTRADAVATLSHISANIEKQLGEPQLKKGDPTLVNGIPHGYVVAYNFKDYRANASGADLGSHGFSVSEHFVNENN